MTRLIRLGAWLGIIYGILEGLAFWAASFIPGALSWRNGNSYYALWFAPVFYGIVFALLGVVVAAASRAKRDWPWERVLVFLCFAIGAFLALMLPGLLWTWACAAFALGIGTQAASLWKRHEEKVAPLPARTFPIALALVAVLAAGSLGFTRAREAWTIGRLPAPPAGRPNIVLLVIDTQRADHLSSYGYGRPTSPRIDRLASEGVLFERAYSHSSWTLPSHASMFDGRPLHEHHAGLVAKPYLDGRFPTIAEVLRDHGYATGGFVANTYWVGRQTGLARGFTRFEDFYGNLGDAVVRTVLGRILTYEVQPKFVPETEIDIPGRKDAAEITDDMLAWIDGRDRARPFFAFANYFDVHAPYIPPKPVRGRFGWHPDTARRGGEIDIGALTGDREVPPEAELRRQISAYDEALLFVDGQIGRIEDALRERGILDSTVIIVTSDHGESWGEHGVMVHGHSIWHDQIFVPLVVRWPKAFPAGTRVPHPVATQQLAATIADLAGIGNAPFPGRSLVRAADLSDPARDTVLVEVGRRSIAASSWPVARGWVAGLVADRWQFILEQQGRMELYDVLADPERNLVASPDTTHVVAAFRSHLNALQVGDGLDRGTREPEPPRVAAGH
jgi:arylsulfatase A-like enzyme